MKYLYRPSLNWLLALLIITQGCNILRPTANSDDSTNNYCAVPHQLFTNDTLQTNKSAFLPLLDTTLLPSLSTRSRQLAHAYGLDGSLRQLGQMSVGLVPTSPAYPAFLKRRKAVVLQIVQASGEALRVTEELECEKQRADQSAVALQRREDKQRNNLTVGSLLVGAASGTISATVKNSDLNLVLTVSTAALSAVLGVASIFVNPQINYPISQNMLSDVWYRNPHTALYPSGLWNVLNEARVGNSYSSTPALLQTIRKRWAKYNQLTKDKPRQQAQQQKLFFGVGGSYHVDDLHTLSNMLTQIEVMVRLVNQDLQKLLVEVSNAEPQ